MKPMDQMLSRISAEITDKQTFIDGIVEDAEKAGRDLSTQEMEMITRARDRLGELNEQAKPMQDASRIAGESAARLAEIAKYTAQTEGEKPRTMEYRSAGAYVLDRWRAGLGQQEAVNRIDLYHRAAAHQTTGDNAGLLPEQILGPVINFVDAARPLVNLLGPRQLPSGSWSRPVVTQHTSVTEQSAEKTELASQKMLISSLPVAATTWGGYVNVSRQNIDWTQPQIMDLIISDLALQYAIQTENEAATTFATAATAGTDLPATPTGDDVAGALWAAAGAIYTATKGAGRVVAAAAPNMLSLIGPLFAPINPQDAQSSGFTAGAFGQGAQGSISGIPVAVSDGVPDGQILVMSTAAAEIYEDRVGSLQVVEPSVLGVQVAYAGYFAPLVIEDAAIIKIVA